jgi:serine/threonine-protein kinase
MDRRTFLKNLKASGLLSERELKSAVKRLPATDRGRVLARALVGWGLLTKFQAELLLAGRTSGFLLGQYRILDQIGQGGMGRVFKAVHQTMNRVVALKVLAPLHMKTEKARALFQREVCAAGRLMHPNIVTAYDASCTDGRHYLAMEFVDGPNLEQLVRELGPLPIGMACDLIRQAANGLQYAFEQGMVHRDIKPSNLLVQPGATGAPAVVKILDFGLARLQYPAQVGTREHRTILTRGNVVMGTPDYLSPEQSRDLHAVDIRSDLYSLGCTFYYLLSGNVPFEGGTSLEKLIRHSSEEAVPVEHFRPELPAAVAAIVRRLMAKDPAERFQTPAELAATLAPFAVAGPSGWSHGEPGTHRGADTAGSPGTDPSGIHPAVGAGNDILEGDGVQVGTLPTDRWPTPLSGEGPPLSLLDDEPSGRRWGRAAVLCAIGATAGLMVLATWLALLGG